MHTGNEYPLSLGMHSITVLCSIITGNGNCISSKTLNLMNILEQIADDTLHSTGFFHSGPELECNRLNPHPQYVCACYVRTYVSCGLAVWWQCGLSDV